MKRFVIVVVGLSVVVAMKAAAAPSRRGPLDPRGKIHLPIGIANTLDTLKTFVEAEANFSPGFGSYGIYFVPVAERRVPCPRLRGHAANVGENVTWPNKFGHATLEFPLSATETTSGSSIRKPTS